MNQIIIALFAGSKISPIKVIYVMDFLIRDGDWITIANEIKARNNINLIDMFFLMNLGK